jgi:hypothetical protein
MIVCSITAETMPEYTTENKVHKLSKTKYLMITVRSMYISRTLSMLMVLVVLITPNSVEAVAGRWYKVLRWRYFHDSNCTVPNIPASPLYASTDGSCFCYQTQMRWSESDTGICHAGSGVVTGNNFNATLGDANRCLPGDPDNWYLSGTLGCLSMPSNYSLFVDVTRVSEPLYIWQVLLIVVCCLLAVVALAMMYRRYRRHRTHESMSPQQLLEDTMGQADT